MTIPITLFLIAFLFTTCLSAQQTAPCESQKTATIYTGNEAPLSFDTDRYQRKRVAPYSILQFLGARCAETTILTATPGLYRYFNAHPHYPEYSRLPLDIYFQPAEASRDEMYCLNTGSAAHHITLPMRYQGTYYVVIRDQVKPSVLIVNSVTLEAQFRRCCALTESIIPAYKN